MRDGVIDPFDGKATQTMTDKNDWAHLTLEQLPQHRRKVALVCCGMKVHGNLPGLRAALLGASL